MKSKIHKLNKVNIFGVSKKILLVIMFMAATFPGFAQEPSVAFQVDATDKAILLPRVANVGLIATPVNGMIVYDISSSCIKFYENDAWTDCVSSASANYIIDSDAVLAQIGNEGDDPDTVSSVVTVAQLGQILPALTGVDAGNETAYQDYIDSAPNNFSSPATPGEVQAMIDAVNSAESLGVPYVVSITGKIWMDRNLGASQIAASSTDTAAYGDLYQWGRATDGHQISTSNVIVGPVAAGAEGANFITSASSPFDWLTPQDDNLWQGTSGTNNPCPTGYRLPTETEFNTERLSWGSNNADGAFASPLKLPVSGYRYFENSTFGDAGIAGYYWTSTVNGTKSRALILMSGDIIFNTNNRADGFSVRCIKD